MESTSWSMASSTSFKLLSIRKEVEPSLNTPRVRLVHLHLFNGGHY